MQDETHHRELPYECRADLQIQALFARGFRFCVVKDPLSLQYWKLDPLQFDLLSRLDGKTSLDHLRIDLQQAFPDWHVTLRDVQQLIIDLQERGLLVTKRAFQATTHIASRRDKGMKKILQAIQNPLFIRLPSIDPNRFLGWLNQLVGWVFHPAMICVWLAYMVMVWSLIYIRRDHIWQQMPAFQQFFEWPNLMYLWFVLGATKIVHEIGHGLATKRIGRDCHTIGAALLVLSPTMYCDATDSWMVASKWKRIGVAAAGMFVEILLASTAFLLWSAAMPGLLKHLLLNVFFVSAVSTVLFNANPLIRFDGYYMLSDWLEIPNLAEEANDVLQRGMGWCLGFDIEDTSRSPAPLWILVSYGIAAFIYRWFLLLTISFGIYAMFKSYKLESIGGALAMFAIGGSAYAAGRGLHTIYKRHNKNEPIRKGRSSVTLIAVLAVISLILFLPIPVYRSAPTYVEPDGVRHVYANRSGQLIDFSVQPGDLVSAGTLIAQLHDPDLADRMRDLETRLAAISTECSSATRRGDHVTISAKQEEQRQVEALLVDVRDQEKQLRIVAPVAGKIVWPEGKAAVTVEQMRTQLTGWIRKPLDPENRFCEIEAGTELCSIAPMEHRFVAKLLVDQQDRKDLQLDRKVRIKFDAHPLSVVTAKVTDIAQEQSEVVSRLLSMKAGGKATTVTDSMGQERLTSTAYLVTVSLDEEMTLPIRTAMRGQARFLVTDRSASQWLWRWVRSTFSFRI